MLGFFSLTTALPMVSVPPVADAMVGMEMWICVAESTDEITAPGGMFVPETVNPTSAAVKLAVAEVTIGDGGGEPVPALVTASVTGRPPTTVALVSSHAEPVQ